MYENFRLNEVVTAFTRVCSLLNRGSSSNSKNFKIHTNILFGNFIINDDIDSWATISLRIGCVEKQNHKLNLSQIALLAWDIYPVITTKMYCKISTNDALILSQKFACVNCKPLASKIFSFKMIYHSASYMIFVPFKKVGFYDGAMQTPLLLWPQALRLSCSSTLIFGEELCQSPSPELMTSIVAALSFPAFCSHSCNTYSYLFGLDARKLLPRNTKAHGTSILP